MRVQLPTILFGFLLFLMPWIGLALDATQKTTSVQPPPTMLNDAEKQIVLKALQQALPELSVDDVESSPIAGVYQILSGANVYYTTPNGQYVFYGDLLDLNQEKTEWNVTETLRKKLRLKFLSKISDNDLVIFKPESKQQIKGILKVFTDVDCIYCRNLHQEVDALLKSGIEVRYLAFPREGPGTKNFSKSVSIWCAEDRQTMFTKATQGEEIPEKSCNNSVLEQYQTGIQLGMRATPTLVFEDGTMISRYLPAEKLIAMVMKHRAAPEMKAP